MARDRLAAIRQAQQQAAESNQQRSYPRQRQQSRDYDEPRDFDPRGGDLGYGGGEGRGSTEAESYQQQPEEPRYRQDYQPEFRQDYRPAFNQQQYEPEAELSQDPRYAGQPRLVNNPTRGGHRSQDSIPSTPTYDYASGTGSYPGSYGYGNESPNEEPPRDFNPHAQSSFDAGQERYADYATPPQQRGQRSQYTPVDPVRTRQRSLSGGKARPDPQDIQSAKAMEQANYPSDARDRAVYPNEVTPRPSGGAAHNAPTYRSEDYEYNEKASTVDLVDGVNDSGMDRRQSTTRKPTKATGRPTIQRGDVPMEDMGEFFTEISDLQTALREANGSIQSLQALHMRILSLPSTDSPAAVALTQELGQLTTKIRDFYASIKNRIQVLAQGNANLRALIPAGQSQYNLSLADVDVRQTQVDALKERFKDAIQRYAEVERDNRAKNRAKMERQVKVVNPDLTLGQVKEMVRAAEEGGGQALFSQALLRTGRSYAAKSALREVESRAAELARIEQTLIELGQLFNDMAVLVEAQDVQIVGLEVAAAKADHHMEKGLENVEAAVVSARSARQWRWWCFGIIVVIILIVFIVIMVEVVVPIINRNKADNSVPPPTTLTTVFPVTSRATATVVMSYVTGPATARLL